MEIVDEVMMEFHTGVGVYFFCLGGNLNAERAICK